MTRHEAESEIMEHLRQIREIALKYDPETPEDVLHISMYILKNTLSVDNYKRKGKILDCFWPLGEEAYETFHSFHTEEDDGQDTC